MRSVWAVVVGLRSDGYAGDRFIESVQGDAVFTTRDAALKHARETNGSAKSRDELSAEWTAFTETSQCHHYHYVTFDTWLECYSSHYKFIDVVEIEVRS